MVLEAQPSDIEAGLEIAAAARAATGDIRVGIERCGGAYAATGLKVVVADAHALASSAAR